MNDTKQQSELRASNPDGVNYLLLAFFSLLVMLSLPVSLQAGSIGDSAKDFTLKSNQGKNIKLSEQVGNVVLINFWASWCGPCRQEMPELEKIQQKYQDLGFTILAVNVDQDSKLADDFLDSISVSYPVLYDPEGKVSELYSVDAMPTTYILDRDGKLRFLHRGYQSGYEDLYEKEVKALVRE